MPPRANPLTTPMPLGCWFDSNAVQLRPSPIGSCADSVAKDRSNADKFWVKVRRGEPRECWPWTSKFDRYGYGRVYFLGKIRATHRIAFFLSTGNMAAGLSVCHSCDNPACCNPGHLFLGTHQLNMADRKAKGRTARGERNGRAKLTWEIVRQIRAAYEPFKVTLPKLSVMFGVNKYIVQDILRGRTWNEEKPTNLPVPVLANGDAGCESRDASSAPRVRSPITQ